MGIPYSTSRFIAIVILALSTIIFKISAVETVQDLDLDVCNGSRSNENKLTESLRMTLFDGNSNLCLIFHHSQGIHRRNVHDLDRDL